MRENIRRLYVFVRLRTVGAVLFTLIAACVSRDASSKAIDHDSTSVAMRDSSPPSDTALQQELLRRVARDQEVREEFAAELRTTGTPSDATARAMMAIDSANIAWLKPLLARGGLPTRARVGDDGLGALFLLVQHADQDVDFQESVLPVLENAFARGEVNGEKLAMLSDRVAKARHRPQIYGTQSTITNGHPIIDPIADSAGVDARRARMGLPPLAVYRAVLDSMYGKQQKR
jgi:hypothetical protein